VSLNQVDVGQGIQSPLGKNYGIHHRISPIIGLFGTFLDCPVTHRDPTKASTALSFCDCV
jgi:hypothetical protein